MKHRNVGATGFTHGMTSRAHLENFNENYYPTVFSNWFLDDWIGSIYVKNASVRLHDFHVLHHELDDSKERHYDPDTASEIYLRPQIKEAK